MTTPTPVIPIRQRLLTAGALKRQTIAIDLGDGETVQVQVRGLSAGARGRLLNATMTPDPEGGDRSIDLERLGPQLVIACAYDPETGQPLFGAADLEAVSGLSATFLDPIIDAASMLSGLGKGTSGKGAEKNSNAIATDTSSSPSSASSAG